MMTMNLTSTPTLTLMEVSRVFADNTRVAMGYCHDSVKSDYHFLFFSFPLMTHSHLHSYSVFSRLLMRHHPMQTFISDSFLVISDRPMTPPKP